MGEGSHIYGVRRRSANPSQARLEARSNTEGGLTREQKATVLAAEARIRNFRTEHGVVVDRDGREIYRTSGSSSRVYIPGAYLRPDSVFTHNHPLPRDLTDNLAGRVGVPLSGQDIIVAARNNLAEVRAVTTSYTFSVRRPANGWGSIDLRAFAEDYARATRGIRESGERLASVYRRSGRISQSDANTINARANVAVQSSAMRELAKKYGFTYTRRRSA